MWITVFLLICTVIDIRTRRLPVWFMLVGSMAAIIFRIINWRQDIVLWMGGIAVGFLFLMVSRWTKEEIGYGDSWMILILGICLGLWDTLLLLSIALTCSGVMALIILMKDRWSKKVSFPFIPFLMIGYVGVLYV